MLKKINDVLSGIPMTALGGICLIVSFVLQGAGMELLVDPAWITVIICGIPLVYLALWRVIYLPGIRKINSALLISIAMAAAIAIGDLFAAGEVVFIMQVGSILEEGTTNRAKKGLRQLISLAPIQARKIEHGEEQLITADQIREKDILRVLPGEIIPVDGEIIEGESSVDQSIMTGESLPVDKAAGDPVFCGTINRFGTMDIRALKVGEDSSLQKLIRMVEEAEKKQAPMQRIADRAASWLVPVALLIAIVTGLVTHNIVRAVTILVVFCPCALVLATPTAIMAAIGQATRHGVIIKSGEALENMGKANVIAFDKTGTLTQGKLEVSDVIPFVEISREKLLALAACAEARSEHPLGKAIMDCVKAEAIAFEEGSAFRMYSGKGVEVTLHGEQILCGNEKFLMQRGISPDAESTLTLKKLREEGKASILVGRCGCCMGAIALADSLRSQACEMIRALKDMQTELVLLTGDHEKTARYFADKAGIRTVQANLLPGEKLEAIEAMQKEGKHVCMIGDGVNDAPALKIADVGVAMGTMGSDIAVEAAEIALMGDDLSKIPYLKRLSNATVATIRFSITLSMCINFIAVSCSVAGILTPTTGALVHNAGSCLVVLIAALLYDRKFDETGYHSILLTDS